MSIILEGWFLPKLFWSDLTEKAILLTKLNDILITKFHTSSIKDDLSNLSLEEKFQVAPQF